MSAIEPAMIHQDGRDPDAETRMKMKTLIAVIALGLALPVAV